jgi:hypothetical protein
MRRGFGRKYKHLEKDNARPATNRAKAAAGTADYRSDATALDRAE